jgi:hypothetical protein
MLSFFTFARLALEHDPGFINSFLQGWQIDYCILNIEDLLYRFAMSFFVKIEKNP